MIVAQLIQAFPGSRFSVRPIKRSWEVCVLHGALQPGMGDWLEGHNLRAEHEAGVDGYVILWLRDGPDRERRAVETVKKFADLGYVTAMQRRLFSENELRGFDRQINEVLNAWKEIDL